MHIGRTQELHPEYGLVWGFIKPRWGNDKETLRMDGSQKMESPPGCERRVKSKPQKKGPSKVLAAQET